MAPRLCHLLLGCAALAGCTSDPPPDDDLDLTDEVSMEHYGYTPAVGERAPALGFDDDTSSGVIEAIDNSPILYHSGPMLATANVYMIYYGNWSTHAASIARIDAFLKDLHTNNFSSDWLAVTHSYTDSGGHHAGTTINAGAHYTVGYTYGKDLRDRPGAHPVYHIVDDAIRGHHLPDDPNGIYFVVPASDVTIETDNIGALCQQYCGFHTWSPTRPDRLKWGVIMNDLRCGASCRGTTSFPNKDAIADPAVSVLAHEITETVTDYDRGWYSANGNENADKCAWTFDNVSHIANGGVANLHDRTHNHFWLIQDNWSRSGGCTMGCSGHNGDGKQCGAHCCPAHDFCGANGACCDGTCKPGCPC